MNKEENSHTAERAEKGKAKVFRRGGEEGEGNSPVVVQTKKKKSLQKRNSFRNEKVFHEYPKGLKEENKQSEAWQKEKGSQISKSPFLEDGSVRSGKG